LHIFRFLFIFKLVSAPKKRRYFFYKKACVALNKYRNM